MSSETARRAEQVALLLGNRRFSQLEWVDETGSTNADLLRVGRGGAVEQARITDHQTTGRGRRDRQWLSPPDAALMMSVLIRRGVSADRLFRVTMAMGLAAVDAVEGIGVDMVTLKWPNDVLIGERKLAGVLAESALGVTPIAVVGIGLNVSADAIAALPDDVAAGATCLGEHVSTGPNTRVELAAAVLDSLARWLDTADRELLAAYRKRLGTIGRKVLVTRDDRDPLEGLAIGVTSHGELVVRVGEVDHTLTVGDVAHVRPTS